MEQDKELVAQSRDREITEAYEEIAYLKSKVAFSLGALEGINYLLKNDDSLVIKQNMEHLRNTVNRVLEDLRRDF
jgi:uncharacterized coiled-coil protein SlyX